MCGRYTQTRPASELASDLDVLLDDALRSHAALRPRYNIAPTQDVPIVLERKTRALRVVRWGLLPSFTRSAKDAPLMINARAESLADKPAFREPLRTQRCLVLADGFYEWKRHEAAPLAAAGAKVTKTPYYLRPACDAPFAFAGLWEMWRTPEGDVIPSCTIITVPPSCFVSSIHDRMPAILRGADFDAWLRYETRDPEKLLPLLRPAPEDALTSHRVSSRVGNARQDDVELIAPVS